MRGAQRAIILDIIQANELVKDTDLILRSALSRQRNCAVRCARLEGWPRVRTLRPSFETLASQAPQDEVGILHGLVRTDDIMIAAKTTE
jgi:hypothetical protein